MAKVPFDRNASKGKLSDIKPKTNKTEEQVIVDLVIAKDSIALAKGKITLEDVRNECAQTVTEYKKWKNEQSLEQ